MALHTPKKKKRRGRRYPAETLSDIDIYISIILIHIIKCKKILNQNSKFIIFISKIFRDSMQNYFVSMFIIT